MKNNPPRFNEMQELAAELAEATERVRELEKKLGEHVLYEAGLKDKLAKLEAQINRFIKRTSWDSNRRQVSWSVSVKAPSTLVTDELPVYLRLKAETILHKAEVDLGPIPQTQWFDLLADNLDFSDGIIKQLVKHLVSTKDYKEQMLKEIHAKPQLIVEDIEPCPFCESTDIKLENEDHMVFVITCNNCEAIGPPSFRSVRAIKFWNNRSKGAWEKER